MAIYYGNKKVKSSNLHLDLFDKQVDIHFQDGSPKGVVATIEDLPSEGDTGVYIVQANKHWYWWNGSTWKDGGIYQATSNTLSNGAVTSINADYAEVGEWLDGNPSNEDRSGKFVTIDSIDGSPKIRIATATDDIRGVIVKAPAFSAGVTTDKLSNGVLLPRYAFVGYAGLVDVIDNGACGLKVKRCMVDDNGEAVPSSNNLGYQIVQRVSESKIKIIVEPSADMIQRIKTDVVALEQNKADKGEIDNVDDKVQTLKTTKIVKKDYLEVRNYGVNTNPRDALTFPFISFRRNVAIQVQPKYSRKHGKTYRLDSKVAPAIVLDYGCIYHDSISLGKVLHLFNSSLSESATNEMFDIIYAEVVENNEGDRKLRRYHCAEDTFNTYMKEIFNHNRHAEWTFHNPIVLICNLKGDYTYDDVKYDRRDHPITGLHIKSLQHKDFYYVYRDLANNWAASLMIKPVGNFHVKMKPNTDEMSWGGNEYGGNIGTYGAKVTMKFFNNYGRYYDPFTNTHTDSNTKQFAIVIDWKKVKLK